MYAVGNTTKLWVILKAVLLPAQSGKMFLKILNARCAALAKICSAKNNIK